MKFEAKLESENIPIGVLARLSFAALVEQLSGSLELDECNLMLSGMAIRPIPRLKHIMKCRMSSYSCNETKI